ncbi:MAG: hypothetical protein MUF53_10790, partial [Gemmatimonadaceae bacterium]|nr:hypothetical protein [Gemmatimonadaceae bacterium]
MERRGEVPAVRASEESLIQDATNLGRESTGRMNPREGIDDRCIEFSADAAQRRGNFGLEQR